MPRRASSNGRFIEAVQSIIGADNAESLAKRVMHLLEVYDLVNISYYGIKSVGGGSTGRAIISNYPVNWWNRYQEQKYYLHDPILADTLRTTLPVEWHLHEPAEGVVGEMFQDRREAGVGRTGVTFALSSNVGARYGFSASTDLSVSQWERDRLTLVRDLQFIAQSVHQVQDSFDARASRGQQAVDETYPPLSEREKQCIRLAAQGMTIARTAEHLAISATTARMYLDNVRHKLKCATKGQAVAKAMQLGAVTF